MKKLILVAAISAIVSGTAFAQRSGSDIEVIIPDAAVAAMGSVAASGGAQVTATEYEESFNSILSGNKAFSDNTNTFAPKFTDKSVHDNVNQNAAGNATNVNGDVEEGGMVQSGHDNLQADGDIQVRNVSANGVAANQQYQIGGGGYGYYGLPAATAQQQGQTALTDNTAIGGNYAPRTVSASGNGIATGFGSDTDAVVVQGSNTGLVAGDDIDVDDSALATNDGDAINDSDIGSHNGNIDDSVLAQDQGVAVGDDGTVVTAKNTGQIAGDDATSIDTDVDVAIDVKDVLNDKSVVTNDNDLIVRDNNLAVDSFNDESTDVDVDVRDNVTALGGQAASKGGENEVEVDAPRGPARQ